MADHDAGPVTEKANVLKVLLKQRHLQGHRAFCREYDKHAAKIDDTLKGGYPSKAQFYRWLSGDVRGLPYADHCRILESMFPGWTAEQLFQEHTGGIGFVPEPPSTKPVAPAAPPVARAEGMADVTAVFTTRPEFSHEMPPHRLFDDADSISIVGLSLNALCQQYSDRSLMELLENGTTVRALFLDPAGEYIKAREREEGHPPGVLATLTTLNTQTLQRLQSKLSPSARENLQIRTYDEPVRFNITVIDNDTCVVQPYLPDARGVESPTLVMERQAGKPAGLFDTFAQVFESMWARSTEVTA
ncbi:DUF5919 domain-containing protein [Amycolatopsis sp. NPDC054798]